MADAFFNGGNVHTTFHRISTKGIAHAGPAALYQSERYGDYTYTFEQLTPGGRFALRLHFTETFWNSPATRRFNVLVNGVRVLKDFDIFAEGGARTAVVREVRTTADPSGRISVQYVSIVDNAESAGIEVLAASSPLAPAVEDGNDDGADAASPQ